MAKTPEEMTKGELVAEVHRLERLEADHALVQNELEVHQEELRAQSDALVESQRLLEQSRDRFADLYDFAPVPYLTLTRVQRRLHVLVVDDSVDFTAYVETLLGMHGYEVTTAHEGSAALELELALRPDVVLLDIGLPCMDGYELARRLRAGGGLERTILAALSGYARDDRAEEGAVFDHYLNKPVQPETLLEFLESLDMPASPTGR